MKWWHCLKFYFKTTTNSTFATMKQSRKQFKMFFKIEKWLTENQKWLRAQPDKCSSKRSNNMSMTNGEIKILEFLQKPKDACLRHNKSLGLHLFFCAMQNGWYSHSGIHLHSCVFDTLVRFQRKLSHQKMCNLSKNVCKQNNKNPINLVISK